MRIIGVLTALLLLTAHSLTGEEIEKKTTVGEEEKSSVVSEDKPVSIVRKKKPEKGRDNAIDDMVPVNKSYMSLPLLLGLDLLVPGGGHFYRGSYWLGGGFVVLKAAGAYSIYHFYQKWDYRRSLYVAAKKANENLDPEHQLLFLTPDGNYRSVNDLKHSYDRAAQQITFAVVANVLLYSASLIINYVYYQRSAGDALPTFNVSFSASVTELDTVISLGYVCRI